MAAGAEQAVGEFKVVKTTADKIAQVSQDLLDEGYLEIAHHFTGGRDWVVIARLGEE